MIKIDEILKEWSEDKIVDNDSAHNDLLRIPVLHGKYLEYLSQHRLASHKAKFDYSKMKKIRREYYLGSLDKETLDHYNWPQFDLKVGNKSNIDMYLDSDEYLINYLEKKCYYDEGVDICESILKQLHAMSFSLKSYLDHTRFLAGSH